VENYAEVRKQCMQQWTALKQERQSWESHWRELSDYFLPRRSKFISRERRRQGAKKNDKIINSVGTFSVRTLGAGMMSGITSPARQWFRLTTDRPEPREVLKAVRTWLDDIERRLVASLMAKSNLYNSLPRCTRTWPSSARVAALRRGGPAQTSSAPTSSPSARTASPTTTGSKSTPSTATSSS
jgi:hypothetical protein